MRKTEIQECQIGTLRLSVSEVHKFGTDALLLARYASPRKTDIVCDLCTGCGIIPAVQYSGKIAYQPEKIYALDIASDAIALLTRTCAENPVVQGKILPLCGDLRQIRENGDIRQESIDLVTVNPPYFRADSGGQRKHAEQAVARHELACTIEDIAQSAFWLLRYGGMLKICHIPERLTDVLAVLRKMRLEPKQLTFVLSPNADEPWLFLLTAKKGGKPGMRVYVRHTADMVSGLMDG